LVVAALAAVVVVAGGSFDIDSIFTGDDSSESAAPVVVTTPTGAGTNTARVDDAGISVDYPSNWSVQPITADHIDSARTFGDRLFGLGGADVDSVAESTKFFAGEFGGPAGKLLLVFTVRDSGIPATFGEFDSELKRLGGIPGLTVLGTSAVPVGDTTAYRVDVSLLVNLPDGTGAAVREGVLVVPVDGGATFIFVAAADDASADTLINDVFVSVRTI